MVMPATLRAMLNAPTRGHDFGPDDSTILSSLYHPVTAGRKLADFLQNNIETAAGLNSGYDNPNPLLGPSEESRVNAALTLAGLMQTGSMPFGPVSKGGTLGSIPVWHGSPYEFDKFKLKNIGKGEGAQVYGHGLYFSESPKVAKHYAINVAENGGHEASNFYKALLEWPDAAREAADPLGPQHFLDWDKPPSDYVYDAMDKNGITRDALYDNSGSYGDAIYRYLKAALGGSKQASKLLKEKGIPGIRYLDQGSRGSGNGTYNYVVFDDKIPRIVERNGVSLRELLGKK